MICHFVAAQPLQQHSLGSRGQERHIILTCLAKLGGERYPPFQFSCVKCGKYIFPCYNEVNRVWLYYASQIYFWGHMFTSTIFNHANSRKAPKGQSLPQPPRPPLSPLPQLYLPPYWAPNSSPLLLLPEQKKHRQQKPRSPWNKRLQLHILRLKALTLLHLMAPLSHMFLYLWRSHLVNFEYAFTLRSIYSEDNS